MIIIEYPTKANLNFMKTHVNDSFFTLLHSKQMTDIMHQQQDKIRQKHFLQSR